MKEKNLMRKLLTQFVICVAILLILATPVFYWLTKSYYAEDMGDLIEAMQAGKSIPKLDLEQDVTKGVMIQFMLIATVLGIAIVLTLRLINKRLWHSFDSTLEAIESFKLEDQELPSLPDTDIKEFSRLNTAITRLIKENIQAYRSQKEFTENASHELQTPLAIFQSKLDILLQQSDNITEQQAHIIQGLFVMTSRLSRLNRNLLLLAKMENNQFSKKEKVDVVEVLNDLLPYIESLAGNITIITRFDQQDEKQADIYNDPQSEKHIASMPILANRSLLESLLNNLIVNAVRHNKQDGVITITESMGEGKGEIDKGDCSKLTIANTSHEKALDANKIFGRFYHSSESAKGNGLGLAIAKAVCDYHGWKISYSFIPSIGNQEGGLHQFEVTF